ncbi:hypothetical protein J4Q44_G00128820 [Coregonus suidteri]|uniref:Uncharacterized protein n=1 Tax=Coregonus suidteri TaxID=861788 RepID=A0AAN8R8F5_9TELE
MGEAPSHPWEGFRRGQSSNRKCLAAEHSVICPRSVLRRGTATAKKRRNNKVSCSRERAVSLSRQDTSGEERKADTSRLPVDYRTDRVIAWIKGNVSDQKDVKITG